MKIAIVAVKEIRQKVLTRTFAVGTILCCPSVATSVGAMVRLYRARVQDYRRNSDKERYELTQLTSWTRLLWRGVTLDREPSPLLVFAAGVERDAQSRVRIDSYWGRSTYVGSSGGNPLLALVTSLDYAATVRIVMSLLTILLLHDAVSGEKEVGTLRLLLASGVPRDEIILGKYLGSMSVASTPFLLGTLLGLIVLAWTLPAAFGTEHLIRIGVLSVVSLVYISAFALLSLFVSACCDRSSTALTALLLLWIVLVLVVPRASVLVARVAVKTKSEAELAGEVRAALDNARKVAHSRWRTWRRKRENRRKPWRERWLMRQEMRREAYEDASWKIRRLRREYMRGLQRQTVLAMDLSRISPASNLSYVAMYLARTDAERSDQYIEAADLYREMTRRVVDDLVNMERTPDIWGSRFRRLGPIDTELLPRFHFREADLPESLARCGLDLGILCALNIVLLMLSHMMFLRYSPV